MNHRCLLALSAFYVASVLGCTGSVYPLLTGGNLLKDSDLSGEWMLELPDKDGNVQKIKIELDGYDTSTYDLTIPEEWLQSRKQSQSHGLEFPQVWTFQVGKIENELFGQLIPRDLPVGPPVAHGMPVYSFGKLTMKDDTIEFSAVSDDRAFIATQEKLPHIKLEPSQFVEMTVFTMPTAQLQENVIKHKDKLFRSRPLILRRANSTKALKDEPETRTP